MIEINNLHKSFDDLKVLSDINLTIDKGQIYGLVGKSGVGKSTLLRCINGLESYSSGSLKVNDTEIKELNKREMQKFRKKVAMIFQHFPMMTRKTVYENIAFPMKCWKYSKEDIDTRVRELAEIVGLTDKLEQKPNTLSGGQKQRVAIARALSMNPEVLLCDEATSALDPVTTKSILQLLREINERLGITIIVVTHQMEVVKEICQQVSLLEDGKIVASGAVKKLFLHQSEALQNFWGREELIDLSEGVNLQIMMTEEDDSKKILSRISSQLQIDYTVCGGRMERYRDMHLGSLIINVEQEDFPEIETFLNNSDVIWHVHR